MGSHTNVNLPGRWDRNTEKELEREKLELEVVFYKEKFEWICQEMENLVEAVRQWGYVDLKVGNEQIKLEEYSDKGKVIVAQDGSLKIEGQSPLLYKDFSQGSTNG